MLFRIVLYCFVLFCIAFLELGYSLVLGVFKQSKTTFTFTFTFIFIFSYMILFSRIASAVVNTLIGLSLAFGLTCAQAVQGKTVLIVGDSISAAYGIAQSQGWVALLRERLANTAPYNAIQYNVINASISGETSAGGAQRIGALIKQYRPAVVVIELGGNDALRGLPIAQTKTNFTTMIRAAKASKAAVLLLPMQIPPNYGEAYAKEFNALYAQLGKAHGAKVANFIFKDFADDLTYFQRDRIHPTAAAQPKMLEAVWPSLQGLLK